MSSTLESGAFFTQSMAHRRGSDRVRVQYDDGALADCDKTSKPRREPTFDLVYVCATAFEELQCREQLVKGPPGREGSDNMGSIPKPNPILDNLLVSLIVCELGIIVHTLWDDKQMLAILMGMFFVVALAVKVTKTSFAIGGGWFSRTFLQHLGDPLKKNVTMKKWCDQSWQLVIHVSMTIFELYVLRDETWWQDTTTLWNQGTDTGVFPTQKFSTKLLYITQLAIWIYTAFSCKFLEEIRKDYLVMMTHHVVTIALVTWSYAVGFMPVGVVVLILHDMTDIPLDMLKMANYLKMEGVPGLFTSEIMFVTTIVLWFYYRIYQYPTKLLYTTLIENREASMTIVDAHDFTQLFPYPGPPSWLLFNVLLTTLYCLHIWWGLLLLRVLVGVVTKGTHNAGKDEYEGTSDSDNEDLKND